MRTPLFWIETLLPTWKSQHYTSSSESSLNLAKPMSRLKAVKYIVLTLNRALLNSLPIIFIGSTGFYFIEGMSLVDSFYFTTVLLTTVGSEVRLLHVYFALLMKSTPKFLYLCRYSASIRCKKRWGCVLQRSIMPRLSHDVLFLSIHNGVLIVAGTILLHNMSLISMIPLELRMTDDELQELSTGRLIQRLKLY
jgi:hypothetical protein